MGSRLDLHTLFESILGSTNVYFQPPESISLNYPCIIYNRDYIKTEYANNSPYTLGKRYLVTIIDKNPDSVIPDKIAAMPKCSFERHFTADNLNHDIFNLYF
jgi:hypothetical protein